MLDGYDDILTVEETCEALKLGYNSVYQLLNSGALKGYRYGRVWRVPKLAIKEFVLENAKLAGREARS